MYSITFELSNLSEEVIKKILLSLNNSKAAGIDHIQAKSLRNGVELLDLPQRNYNKFKNKTINLPRAM